LTIIPVTEDLKGGLMMAITKDMTIAQILRSFPQTADVFRSYGMHCLSCPGATGESLEQAAMVHGFDTDKILADLLKVVQ
jgi:hybrid cluster-associated redox disulfide protein